MKAYRPIAAAILLAALLFATDTTAQSDQKAELVVQTGHSGHVESISFSPDEKILASGGVDRVIVLWDAATGLQIKSLVGHTASIESVCFSPDGKILASGSMDGTVRLWDVQTGRQLRSLKHRDGAGEFNSIAFSPDGKTLAGGHSYGIIFLWDVESGQENDSLMGHTDDVNSVVFSHDGKTLVSGDFDNTIILWNLENGQKIKSLTGHTKLITSVAYSSDGKTIASSSIEKTIRLWSAETGQQIASLEGHTDSVWSVKFSSDGKTLVSSSADKTAKLWDVSTGQETKTFRGHTDSVRSVSFSPDGLSVVTGGTDKTVRFWNIETGAQSKTLESRAFSAKTAAFSPTGTAIASGFYDNNQIRLWNIKSSEQVKNLEGHTKDVESLAFSTDGKTLASGSTDGTIKIWDVEIGHQIKSLAGQEDGFLSVAFSPDGRILAGGSWRGTVVLWEVESGRKLRTLIGHTGIDKFVRSVAFSPDGETLASGSDDDTIRLWNVGTGQQIKILKGHESWVVSVAFAPDGKTLASGSENGVVKLWNVIDGKQIRSLDGFHRDINSVAFSPDGKTLAIGGFSDSIKLWNVGSGQQITDLKGHTESINSVSFSQDGRFVISSSRDATVKLWQLQTGEPLFSLSTLGGNDWTVTTPEGLFDASPNAKKLMRYVLGLEPVSLEQMKDAYYVPGLLQKILNGDPLPKIELFSKKDLFPEVEFSPPKAGQTTMPVKITNRGGGIGAVQVLVNGKEIIADARPANFDPQTKQPVTLNVSMKDAPLLNGQNRIEVIAKNAAGSLTNRGTPRSADEFVTASTQPAGDPNIYIIAGGISNYTGENWNLNFAAKDAEDFAKAVEIGAVKIFKGDKSKVHVRLLTSNGERSGAKFSVPDARIYTATKADFERAFADFKGATPNDVFIVYLAGHGLSLNLNQNRNLPGGNTYLYLTQETTIADKSELTNENTRKAMTLSGEELKDLMKLNKALKQVLILDTCASGAASASFVAKRNDVPSDQIVALERLKTNTGFYILMGSAADAVSYETSRYGQGLLTYSLLQAMKGAKLRADQFADIELLFGYAKDTVGQLAKNIGGIQRPETITPDVSRSFDIGQFTAAERNQITLANPLPLILRPKLTNTDRTGRTLDQEMEKAFRAALRQASFVAARANPAQIIFVEADEMPDAIFPSGDYSVKGETLTISLLLFKNNAQFGKEIVVTGKLAEKEAVMKQMVEKIIAAQP